MSDEIPVTFDFGGESVKGFLKQVMGAGSSSMFYLSVPTKEDPKKAWYYGRLRYNEHPLVDGWVFDPTPKTGELAELAEFFGSVIISWYDSHH